MTRDAALVVTQDSAPVLSVEGYSGSLDVLVALARTERLDLARMPIAALIDAFATALETALADTRARPARLGQWGDWLVLAATLTLLRSRLLLAATPHADEAAQHEAEALRSRLLDRARMAAAASWLEHRAQLGQAVFARGAVEEGASATPARAGDLVALLRACLVALAWPSAEAGYRPVPGLWRTHDAALRIAAVLAARPEGGALAAFLPDIARAPPERALRCRAAVASTFLAGLELARGGALHLDQPEAFGPLWLGPAP